MDFKQMRLFNVILIFMMFTTTMTSAASPSSSFDDTFLKRFSDFLQSKYSTNNLVKNEVIAADPLQINNKFKMVNDISKSIINTVNLQQGWQNNALQKPEVEPKPMYVTNNNKYNSFRIPTMARIATTQDQQIKNMDLETNLIQQQSFSKNNFMNKLKNKQILYENGNVDKQQYYKKLKDASDNGPNPIESNLNMNIPFGRRRQLIRRVRRSAEQTTTECPPEVTTPSTATTTTPAPNNPDDDDDDCICTEIVNRQPIVEDDCWADYRIQRRGKYLPYCECECDKCTKCTKCTSNSGGNPDFPMQLQWPYNCNCEL